MTVVGTGRTEEGKMREKSVERRGSRDGGVEDDNGGADGAGR